LAHFLLSVAISHHLVDFYHRVKIILVLYYISVTLKTLKSVVPLSKLNVATAQKFVSWFEQKHILHITAWSYYVVQTLYDSSFVCW